MFLHGGRGFFSFYLPSIFSIPTLWKIIVEKEHGTE